MKLLGVDESTKTWLERPLCRRYAAAVFSSIRPRLRGDGADSQDRICWALGTLIDGEAEILGVWLDVDQALAVSPPVLADVYPRGAEFIRFGLGNLAGAEAAFKQTYRHGEILGSIEQAFESAVATVPARDRAAVSAGLRASVDAVDLETAQSGLARFQASALGERYPAVVTLWSDALSGLKSLHALHPQLRERVRSADRQAAEVRGRLTRAILRHGPFVNSAAAFDFVATTLQRAECRLDRDNAAALAGEAESGAGVGRIRQLGGRAVLPSLA
jgi:transposase-like protein